MANASGVRFTIHSAAVPLSTALVSAVGEAQALEYALSGGEDYELLFTLPPDRDVPDEVTVIGTVGTGEGIYCDVMSREQGYEHFH